MGTVKTSVSIDDELLKKIDSYAKTHYISRSAVLSLGARQLILQDEVIQTLGAMRSLLSKISNENELTKESKEQMEQFESICNALITSGG